MEVTGQAVAQLTRQQQSPPDPPPFRPRQTAQTHQTSGDTPHPRTSGGNVIPKMPFPTFTGEHPCIWKEKCLDYFHLFNIPRVFGLLLHL